MNCKICNSDGLKLYFHINGYDILKCPQCGFGQVPITKEALALLYEEDYSEGRTTDKFSQTDDAVLDAAHIYWLEDQLALAYRASAPLRVLKIGPGLGGHMAAYLKKHHPDVQYEAIEISDYAAESLAARGFAIHKGGINTPSIVEACHGRFDLIVGNEVIEHDPDPHAFARAVHTMLKPGGWSSFTTGDIDGIMARWKKEKWYYLDPPVHVSYYTPKAFRTLFGQEGFHPLTVQHYGFQHINLKLRTHLPGILLLSHLFALSTGMTLRAQRK